ncbi:MAG: nucleotidyltransferase domain-containing protein [Peptococcaceae bacterium]|nr:nucleotidyltransferase domain-containing protein [Peptococcaceae bacterium]
MTILLPKITEYLEEHDSISAAWLFGSAATGKLKEGSDIDIAVLFVSGLSKQERFDLRLKLAGEMTRLAGRTVDVVDIQAVPLYFQHQIRKEGSLIVEKDHHYRISFDVRSRREYFDILPVLQRRNLRLIQRALGGEKDG